MNGSISIRSHYADDVPRQQIQLVTSRRLFFQFSVRLTLLSQKEGSYSRLQNSESVLGGVKSN